MEKLTPLQIKNISKVIALPYEQKEDPNYLSAQQLVDYFNAFGFGDDYRYPSIGIVTADIGENLSRQKVSRHLRPSWSAPNNLISLRWIF